MEEANEAGKAEDAELTEIANAGAWHLLQKRAELFHDGKGTVPPASAGGAKEQVDLWSDERFFGAEEASEKRWRSRELIMPAGADHDRLFSEDEIDDRWADAEHDIVIPDDCGGDSPLMDTMEILDMAMPIHNFSTSLTLLHTLRLLKSFELVVNGGRGGEQGRA